MCYRFQRHLPIAFNVVLATSQDSEAPTWRTLSRNLDQYVVAYCREIHEHCQRTCVDAAEGLDKKEFYSHIVVLCQATKTGSVSPLRRASLLVLNMVTNRETHHWHIVSKVGSLLVWERGFHSMFSFQLVLRLRHS